jgi:catechol 2,3-dioxygenase-like lactoylglutathione lyase family enzyme
MLQVFQLALVSHDLPGSVRLYAEAFGFRNAGGQCSWNSRVQGIGADARHVMWWLIGQQEFFQLEIFQYSRPESRSLAEDWRPSDLGWVRFGIIVADFEVSVRALKTHAIEPISSPIEKDGRRHVAFRDPYAGVIVEIIECDPQKPEGPVVAYATSSVSDLQAAREFYRDLLEFELLPLEILHAPSDEAVWGLPGASRDGFLVNAGGLPLEIVKYHEPTGRAKPADYRLSDQGIMNIALGARRAAPVCHALDRLAVAGYVPPFRFENGENVCGYINVPEREIEFASVPETMDEVYGFAPARLGFIAHHVKNV